MIVDVHFNIGDNWGQKVIYMTNERNWDLLHLSAVASLSAFASPLCSFFVSLVF